MNPGSLDDMIDDEQGNWVLLKLALEFDKQCSSGRSAPLTDEGIPVVSCLFDPYSYNIIAPDHCIAGITKSILKVCFSELEDSNTLYTAKLDQLITVCISKMGITGHSCIYNRKTKSLNSLSMSTLFALITILPSILKGSGLDDKLECLHVINTFSGLVALLYWWPDNTSDSLEIINYVQHTDQYYNDLASLVFRFTEHLQFYYNKNGLTLRP